VEAALRSEHEASAILRWEKMVRSALREDPAFAVAADYGLARVMQRIRAEAKPVASRRGWYGWLSDLVARFTGPTALALACGVVAVQFAVIVQIWPDKGATEGYSNERSVPGRSLKFDSFLRISFRPDAREDNLRALLREAHAEVVAGPSQIGDYYIVVAKADVQSALGILQASAFVDSVEIANELPLRQ
jgi:type IV secretory pathway VirB2 component (pilin)